MNFIHDALEKMMRLTDINTNPIMKDCLALKGGTAINLTVFDLPRLSVDIDLDYCATDSRDEMLRTREAITADLKIFLASEDYTLSPLSKNRHSLDSFVLLYRNRGNMRDNSKIEINYSLRSHIFTPEQRKIRSSLTVDDQLLQLTDGEQQFLALFREKSYQPELLFSDTGILNNIAHHPMIEWKLQNHDIV